MNRQINIDISAPSCKEVQHAISHFVSWSPNNYDKLIICDDFPDRWSGNIMAYFKNTLNGDSYTICALWDKQQRSFSFHS